MLKFFVSLVLSFSFLAAKANIITLNDYSLNTDTAIITSSGSGSLEWLRWSETLNQPLNAATTAYQPDGWRVANHTEIASMLNDWFPGSVDPANGQNSTSIAGNADFLAIFGSASNQQISAWYDVLDPGMEYWGQRATISSTNVLTSYGPWGGNYGGITGPDYGVALVRGQLSVPAPSTFLLFGFGLIALTRFRGAIAA